MSEWETERLDLDGYLARLGAEPGAPDAETLSRLHRAHVAAVPFENLDIMLGRGIRVDLPGVQDKLVTQRRGGYCYEHGVLFAAALERIGFVVDRLLARIGHDVARPRPRTHMALHVTAADGEWLADVGFGAALLEPMPWGDHAPYEQGGWRYRLRDDDDGTRTLYEERPDGWEPMYSFTRERHHLSDVTMANHFTATHPSSPFVAHPVVMKRDEGSRTRLHGRTLEVTRPDGTSDSREVDREELRGLVADVFGIRLRHDEVDVAFDLEGRPT